MGAGIITLPVQGLDFAVTDRAQAPAGPVIGHTALPLPERLVRGTTHGDGEPPAALPVGLTVLLVGVLVALPHRQTYIYRRQQQ